MVTAFMRARQAEISCHWKAFAAVFVVAIFFLADPTKLLQLFRRSIERKHWLDQNPFIDRHLLPVFQCL